MAMKDFDKDYIRRFDDGRIIMALKEFRKLSEEEQTAELLGMGIEYAEEYGRISADLALLRNIYKKYCLDHGITPDNWYLGIYE